MNEAYYHGYYGKGTVSRRNPNQAMIIPQDLLHNWIVNLTNIQNERQNIGSDKRHYDTRGGIGAITNKDSNMETENSSSNTDSVPNTIPSSTSSTPAMDTKPSNNKYTDPLITYANNFESEIFQATLPDAFYCASQISSHNHDVFSFEEARSIAHYVSCPPPRLRHIQPIGKQTNKDTPSTTIENTPKTSAANSIASPPTNMNSMNNNKVRFEHMVFETSILEPEAVIYLLAMIPDRIVILPSHYRDNHTTFLYSEVQPYSLTLQYLWDYFCTRIRNFPARFSVYYSCRQLGYIVRDGHAFGTDFVLYTYGPGNGHAISTVMVMPLFIEYSQDHNHKNPEIVPNDEMKEQTFNNNVNEYPPILAPLQEHDVLSNWEQAHAHARVMGTIRKSFLLAYPAITIPSTTSITNPPTIVQPNNPNYYHESIAQYLRTPDCVLQMKINQMDTSNSTNNNDNNITSTPIPTINVHLQAISRWITSKEHKFKSEILLSKVAAMEILNESLQLQKMEQDLSTKSSGTLISMEEEPLLNTTNNNNNNSSKPVNKKQRQQQLRQVLQDYSIHQQQNKSTKTTNNNKMESFHRILPTVTSMVLSLYETDTDEECIKLAKDIIHKFHLNPIESSLPNQFGLSSHPSSSLSNTTTDPQPLDTNNTQIQVYKKYTISGGSYHQSLLTQAYQQLYSPSTTSNSSPTSTTNTATNNTNIWYMDRTVWSKLNYYGRR